MKWFYNHLKSNVKDRDIIAPHIDNPNAVCDECTFVTACLLFLLFVLFEGLNEDAVACFEVDV